MLLLLLLWSHVLLMISSQIYWSMYELIIISVEKEKLLQKNWCSFFAAQYRCF